MSMDKNPSRIAEQAAEYFARNKPGAGPESSDDLVAWLQADPRHARAYGDMQRAWEQSAALHGDAELQALKSADLTALRRPTRRWHRAPMLATAAALMLVVSGTYLFSRYLTPPPPIAYATVLGERRTETLPDGSQIVLNTGTALQVVYARNRREIDLQHGEAQFEVAPDASRPFMVKAGEGSVTALGTRFQVRHDDADAVVTLLEGSVEVALGQERRKLRANEQARLSAANGIAVQAIDPDLVAGWLDGWLRFRGTPLGEVVAEANRYSARKLRLGDPKLAGIELSGNFRTGDSASIASAASLILPARVENSGKDIVLMPQ